jgi:hypothetical protein
MRSFPRVAQSSDLHSRDQVLSRPSPVPSEPGVYAWYFKQAPAQIDTTGCYSIDGMTLLYVGISPKEPPSNGRPPSRSTLRKRLQTHFRGNAEGSTLRKTLGCLLAAETGFPLRRVGSGTRQTFTNPGERALDIWMGENAFVTWFACDRPWELEQEILSSGIPLPLNIQDNPCQAHTALVRSVRRNAVAAALELPIVADNGGPRRVSR